MRWETNPLYSRPAPWRMSGPLTVVWIAAMVGFTAYLIVSEHFLFAALYGVVSIAATVYGVRREWNR